MVISILYYDVILLGKHSFPFHNGNVIMLLYVSVCRQTCLMYVCVYVGIYVYICHTGVVYDNISIVFVLWASSINNKVGLVLFANVYLRYQSVVICRRWLYSLS